MSLTNEIEDTNLCSGCAISYADSKKFYDNKILNFLINHGVVKELIDCPKCESVIKLNRRTWDYRCQNLLTDNTSSSLESCQYSKKVIDGTLFHEEIIPIISMFRVVSAVLSVRHPREEFLFKEVIGVHPKIVNDCYLPIREVFIDAVAKNTEKLGGEGVSVELSAASYLTEKLLGEWDWVFGGIDRNSGETFLVPLELYNAKTLREIILEKIKPGSIIASDCPLFHIKAEELRDLDTQNIKIIATKESNIAQTIEDSWKEVKESMSIGSCSKQLSYDVFAEYLFKSKYPAITERLHNFFKAAANLYPPSV